MGRDSCGSIPAWELLAIHSFFWSGSHFAPGVWPLVFVHVLRTGLIELNRLFLKKERACSGRGMYVYGGCWEEWDRDLGGWDGYAQQTLCML